MKIGGRGGIAFFYISYIYDVDVLAVYIIRREWEKIKKKKVVNVSKLNARSSQRDKLPGVAGGN